MSSAPLCSALNVNVFILGVDSLTTKTAKTMITTALMKKKKKKKRVWDGGVSSRLDAEKI